MNDWDEFTANARSEEYCACSVVIDGEAFKNVAIRGKGNTSLSSVTNDRYSYKIEFDHYDNTKSYYGLDKLVLNNVIQDNTYMKDYLTYTMMNSMGVAAPLCSYAYITVNGEDWSLYLAVEGVEEAFLQRNYGKDYGELYKPDSMSMGGGRGNGDKFDMDEFMQSSNASDKSNQSKDNSTRNAPSTQAPGDSTTNKNEQPSDFIQGNNPSDQLPEGMTPPDFNSESFFGGEMPDFSQMPQGATPPTDENGNLQIPESFSDMFGDSKGGFGGFGRMGMGSSYVKLQYIDDDPDSYSNIFGNAKTDITNADKTRLIEALKKLSDGEISENTVDIEAVIRYFSVHNFVVNSDSYTGSMIHNYYLYEKNGKLQMIPWDYNLAFGSFMATGSATSSVNDPIDTPLSVNGSGDRPMIDWIFNNEEYTELYHQIFSEFIEKYFDSGYLAEMIDKVTAMISPFVEMDPSKFCTYEEFEKGAATLKDFCMLRAESVKGQLGGTIGSTSATQKTDTLIDASHINTSDMGTMGGGKGGFGDNMQMPQINFGSSKNDSSDATPSDETDTAENNSGNKSRPQMPGNFASAARPGIDSGKIDNTQESSDGQTQKPDGSFPDKGQPQAQPQSMISAPALVMIGISVVLLGFGIILALRFKRRK